MDNHNHHSSKTVPAKKILLFENDEAVASVYQARLQAESFEVYRIPHSDDSWVSTAIRYRPDLILIDVSTPKAAIFDDLDILRKELGTTNVKIVMLATIYREIDQQRADKLAVDDYLPKSKVVIADVVDKIKGHLGL